MEFLLDPDVVVPQPRQLRGVPRAGVRALPGAAARARAEPVEFLGRRFHELTAEARAALAAFVGARADDLVFVPNATSGLNAVIRSLRLGPGTRC